MTGAMNGPPSAQERRAIAVDAAAKGYPVVPVKITWTPDGDKIVRPLIRWEADGPLRDVGDVTKAWTKWPDAFPAIPTGVAGLVVADLDVKNGHDGLVTWQNLALPDGYPVDTPSGGRHHFYADDPERPVRTCAPSPLGAGVDVRGRGGLIFLWAKIPRRNDLSGVPGPICEYVPYGPNDPTEPAAPGSSSVEDEDLFDVPGAPFADRPPAGDAEVLARVRELADELRATPMGAGWSDVSSLPFRAGQYAGAGQIGQEAATDAMLNGIAKWTWRRPEDRAKYRNEVRKQVRAGMSKPYVWTGASSPNGAEAAAGPIGDPEDEARIERQVKTIEIRDEARRRARKKKGRKAGDPGRYFHPVDGLLVKTVAREVVGADHFAWGLDGRLWIHDGGVWVPAQHEIVFRVAKLLGERHRNSHGSNVESFVRAHVPELSAEPVGRYINFKNGLLDRRTGELVPHSHEVLSTVQLGCEWLPDATCPRFDRFLSEVLAPDAIGTMWEIIGYLMYSGNPLHRAILLLGPGRNGKGTLIRLVKTLLGERNCSSVTLNSLNENRFAAANLFGRLANLAGDIEATFQKETARFKSVTGGDTITAERKNAQQFEFTPWCSFVFSANEVPGSADTSEGYLSRWVPIRFPHEFAHRPDLDLDGHLQTPEELAGIAARAVPALARLLDRRNFDLPASMVADREEFVRKIDQVRRWLEECCETGDFHESRAITRASYGAWASSEGVAPLGATNLYSRLTGLPSVREVIVRGERGFRGFRVRDHRMIEHITDGNVRHVDF